MEEILASTNININKKSSSLQLQCEKGEIIKESLENEGKCDSQNEFEEKLKNVIISRLQILCKYGEIEGVETLLKENPHYNTISTTTKKTLQVVFKSYKNGYGTRDKKEKKHLISILKRHHLLSESEKNVRFHI